ncbi:MAG: repeat-containing protein [Thermoleophilia bacterium]|nr:repeat-containing protein [Thermoleophilia bacterium]
MCAHTSLRWFSLLAALVAVLVPARSAHAAMLGFSDVAAGNLTSAGIRSGSAWTWGSNTQGRLGITTSGGIVASPVQVVRNNGSALANVSDVSVGTNHGAAVAGAAGSETAWAWGGNANGQLGAGDTLQRNGAIALLRTGGAAFPAPVKQVSAGADFTLVLLTDGTVWATGINDSGQLGNDLSPLPAGCFLAVVGPPASDEHCERAVQVQVNAAGAALTGIDSISAGSYHALALDTAGPTVYSWGANGVNQLGHPSTGFAAPVLASAGGANFANATRISAGYNHSVAVKAAGTVWSWGANGLGQHGTNNTAGHPYPAQMEVSGGASLTNVSTALRSISAGTGFTLLVRDVAGDVKSVKSVGARDFGQLATNVISAVGQTFAGQALGPASAALNGATNGADQVAAGADHGLARRTSGGVWAFGDNWHGELGTCTVGPAQPFASAVLDGSADCGGINSGAALPYDWQTTQDRADGTTVIPLGAWQAGSTVVLTWPMADGSLTAADRIVQGVVEVRPVGTPFSGGADCTSTTAAGGVNGGYYVGGSATIAALGASMPSNITVPGLASDQQYHWQACTRDTSGGGGSAWASHNVAATHFGVDTLAPTLPAVNDGTAAPPAGDVDAVTAGGTSFDLTWTAATDGGIGVRDYDWCINDAADCSTPERSGASVAATTVTSTGAALAGGMHYSCVRATDQLAHASAYACSDGFVVDTAVPSPPVLVAPAAGASTGFTPVLDAQYLDGETPGILQFELCGTATCGSPPLQTGSSTLVTPGQRGTYTLSTVTAGTYWWRARGVDGAGQVSGYSAIRSFTATGGMSVTGITPSSIAQGRRSVAVQVTGTGFASGAAVSVSGTNVTVASSTWVSATRVDAVMTVSGTAALGARDVTVTNPSTATSSGSGLLTIAAPSISVVVSTLGYDAPARDTSAPYAMSFGTVTPGAARAIGPATSGQVLVGDPALRIQVTSDTDYDALGSATDFTGPATTIDQSALAWSAHGGGAATAFAETASPLVATQAPGTRTHEWDLTMTAPALQGGGSYSGSVALTVIAAP